MLQCGLSVAISGAADDFSGLQHRYTSTLLAGARKPAQPGESHAIARLRPLVPAIDLLPIKQGSVDEDNW